MKENIQKKLVYDGFLKVHIIETPEGPREEVCATDSVSVLLYNPDEKYILLIRQARAPMISDNNANGLILETVAGRFDVNLDVRTLAVKEIAEEVGITIAKDDIYLLNNGKPLAPSPGILTEHAYLAMAKIDIPYGEATDRVFGVADEGESIKRVFMRFDKITDYLKSGKCEDLRVFTLLTTLLISEDIK